MAPIKYSVAATWGCSKMRKVLRQRLLASTVPLGLFVSAPAVAQVALPAETAPETAQEEPQDVVVTGSRIARPDLDLASPVTVIGQQELTLRQPGTAEELLRDLPSVRPSVGPGVNNGSDGSAAVDLRGIGSQRTLVLLDGRRIVPFGLDNVVDTNVIPIGLIDRVEVLTGGASSTYGADAVAGVVNYILKRDFSGLSLSGNYRISERGDAARYRADLLIGGNFADGRGNAVLGVGYTKANPLLHTARDISEIPISSTTGQFSGATAAQVTIFASPSNAALGLPASSFGAVVDPSTGLLRAATAADTYNTNNGTYFQTPLNKVNVFGSAHYEITPGIEFYTNALYSRSEVNIQLASSGTFSNTYYLPLNNPYLTTGIRNQLCSARGISAAACATAAAVRGGPGTAGYIEIPVVAQRRFTELGPRGNRVTSDMYQLQGGLRGDLAPKLHYDIYAQYGQTNQEQVRDNWGSYSRVQQALRAYTNASGTAQCADTSNGCVPLNLFGPNGSITDDQLAFINLDAMINRKTTLTNVVGSISGDLFDLASPLAASKIGFAVGAEYRKIRSESQPDAASQIQGEVLGTGARTPPDVGQYDVKEVFGELNLPLVEDKPFFYRLTAEAGVRYSDYSTTGGSTTWKAGGSWFPVRGFKLRGEYSVAVRSPNISELYASPVQGLGNLTVDPCAGTITSAGLRDLCIATGAPASTIGSIPQPTSGQINNTSSGNRNLDVERARTWTVGGVLTPVAWPGFSLTADYFHIRVSDAITQPAQGDILNGCYSAALNPTFSFNAFCQLIGRNPLTGSLNGAGETPGVILTYSNLGVIETAGLDLGVSQTTRLEDLGLNVPGRIQLSFNATRLSYYHFQATPNAINRDCTAYYSTNCTNPRPKYKWNTRLTYGNDTFDISLLWTHISKVALEPYLATRLPGNVPQPGGPNPSTILPAFRSIPRYDYFDLSINLKPAKNFQLTLTVDNLFDKDPPLVGSGVGGTAFNSGNTFPTIYDPIGRAFTIGASMNF